MMRFILMLGKVLVLIGIALSLQAAETVSFKKGMEYTESQFSLPHFNPAVPLNVIEVLGFFWYGCPHCYEVEMNPAFSAWRSGLPKDVAFERVPVTLGRKQGEIHAHLYYTIQALFPNVRQADLVHRSVFQAIKNNPKTHFLIEETDLTAFFNSQWKIQPAVFKQQWTASQFYTELKLNTVAKRYPVAGVPTFLVGGRYVTGPSQVNPNKLDVPALTKTLDFLIEEARKPPRI